MSRKRKIRSLIEEWWRSHIHSDKSSLKAKKWHVSQEYHCRWWKICLSWQCLKQRSVHWQGWISAAYPKGGDSLKKGYAMCKVGSPWFNHIGFLNHRHSIQTCILNSCNVYMKFLENTQHPSIGGTLCFSLITQESLNQKKI